MATATVEITVDQYSELMRDSQRLAALEANGVDNWIGYSAAMDSYFESIE